MESKLFHNKIISNFHNWFVLPLIDFRHIVLKQNRMILNIIKYKEENIQKCDLTYF